MHTSALRLIAIALPIVLLLPGAAPVEAAAVRLIFDTDIGNDIDDALAKLDAGTYGVCEECGRPIGEARLQAMPAARLCIEHASARR